MSARDDVRLTHTGDGQIHVWIDGHRFSGPDPVMALLADLLVHPSAGTDTPEARDAYLDGYQAALEAVEDGGEDPCPRCRPTPEAPAREVLASAEQALYVALCVDDTLTPAVKAAYEKVAAARRLVAGEGDR